MNLEKSLNKENRNYEEDILRFKKAKEKVLGFGFFDKKFIEKLNIYIAIPSEEEKSEDIPCITLDNQLTIFKRGEINLENDVIILPELVLNLDKLSEIEYSYIKQWFENIDFKEFFSFDTVAVHEIAHAKSFQKISPKTNYKYFSREMESDYLNQKKFIKEMEEFFKKESSLQNIKNVDFSKFDFSLRDWTEIYALIYQREFLRKDNPDNEEKIEKWDNHILKVSEEIGKMVINEEIPSDKFYESHTFSYLLARPLEKKFKNFDERINFLESFKK